MNLEEEERVILHKFDEYCQKKSINLPLDINDKKKLIQMIIILEKLQNNNPQRYISTLKRMGLDKILNQNNQNNEISIFDAILAFYSASITYSTDGGNTNNKQQQSSDDIFEYIKNNQWDSISKLVKKNSHGIFPEMLLFIIIFSSCYNTSSHLRSSASSHL